MTRSKGRGGDEPSLPIITLSPHSTLARELSFKAKVEYYLREVLSAELHNRQLPQLDQSAIRHQDTLIMLMTGGYTLPKEAVKG